MKLCIGPWSTISIDDKGRVSPCLCNDWHKVGAIGNVIDNDFETVFASEELHNFKNKILKQDYSSCSIVCPEKGRVPDRDISVLDNHRYPKHVLLSIDKNCNLACESCRTTNIFNNLADPNAVKILKHVYEFYKDKNVTLQFDGAGDVFASKAYKDFLQQDFGPNWRFQIITNGNLLIKNEKIIDRLKDNIISVDVSLDAGSNQTYKDVRGGNFEIVKKGIMMCVDKNIRTNISFVVQNKNYKEILDAWNLGVKLKCNSLNLHKIRKWEHMTEQWWSENCIENLSKLEKEKLITQLDQMKTVENIVTKQSIPVYMTGDLRNFYL